MEFWIISSFSKMGRNIGLKDVLLSQHIIKATDIILYYDSFINDILNFNCLIKDIPTNIRTSLADLYYNKPMNHKIIIIS